MTDNPVLSKKSRRSVVSTLIAGHNHSCNTLNYKKKYDCPSYYQKVEMKEKIIERYELLDQTIDSILQIYAGLRRAFVKGHPRHPLVGDVGERWVPLHAIIKERWPRDEAKTAAALVEAFVSEYGADEVINFNVDDMLFEGKYTSHSVQLWPVCDATKECRAIDREAYRVLCNLLALYD